MTFAEVADDLNEQYEARQRAYKEWRRTTAESDMARFPFNGPEIKYAQIDEDLIQATKDEFGFTDEMAWFIHGEAYERYHSCYSDMPWGMHGLCEFAKKIIELK